MPKLYAVLLIVLIVSCNKAENPDILLKNGDPRVLPPMLLGIPNKVRGVEDIKVTLSNGTEFTEYRFNVLFDRENCSDAAYPDQWYSVSTQLPIAGLLSSDGKYTVCVQARINPNIQPAFVGSFTFTLDRTPPGNFQITEPAQDKVNTPTPRVRWTAADGVAAYELKVGTAPGCINPIQTHRLLASETTVLLSQLGEGIFSICLVAIDELGNVTPSTDYNRRVTVDLSPSTAVLSGTPSAYTRASNATIGVSGQDLVGYKYAFGINIDCGTTSYGDEFPLTAPISIPSMTQNKTSRLCVLGKDSAGNWQAPAQSTVAEWIYDMTPPVAPRNGGMTAGGFLDWNRGDQDDTVGYVVVVRTNSSDYWCFSPTPGQPVTPYYWVNCGSPAREFVTSTTSSEHMSFSSFPIAGALIIAYDRAYNYSAPLTIVASSLSVTEIGRLSGQVVAMHYFGQTLAVLRNAGQMEFYSLANPASPTLVSQLKVPGNPSVIRSSMNRGILMDTAGTIFLIDLSNPANPSLLAQKTLNSYLYDVQVSGDTVAVLHANLSNFSRGEVQLFKGDSNFTTLTTKSNITFASGDPRAIAFVRGILTAGTYTTLYRFNCLDTQNPIALSSYTHAFPLGTIRHAFGNRYLAQETRSVSNGNGYSYVYYIADLNLPDSGGGSSAGSVLGYLPAFEPGTSSSPVRGYRGSYDTLEVVSLNGGSLGSIISAAKEPWSLPTECGSYVCVMNKGELLVVDPSLLAVDRISAFVSLKPGGKIIDVLSGYQVAFAFAEDGRVHRIDVSQPHLPLLKKTITLPDTLLRVHKRPYRLSSSELIYVSAKNNIFILDALLNVLHTIPVAQELLGPIGILGYSGSTPVPFRSLIYAQDKNLLVHIFGGTPSTTQWSEIGSFTTQKIEDYDLDQNSQTLALGTVGLRKFSWSYPNDYNQYNPFTIQGNAFTLNTPGEAVRTSFNGYGNSACRYYTADGSAGFHCVKDTYPSITILSTLSAPFAKEFSVLRSNASGEDLVLLASASSNRLARVSSGGSFTVLQDFSLSSSALRLHLNIAAVGTEGVEFMLVDSGVHAILGRANTFGYVHGSTQHGNYSYFAGGTQGVQVVNTDPNTAPSYVRTVHHLLKGEVSSVDVAGNILIAGDSGGVAFYSLASPSNPTFIEYLQTFQKVKRVAHFGNVAYAVSIDGTLTIINLAGNPQIVQSSSIDSFLQDVKVIGTQLYTTGSKLNIYSLSQPLSPSKLGEYVYPNDHYMEQIDVSGNYAYVTNWFGMLLLDISNPASVALIKDYRSRFHYPDYLKVINGFLYVADGNGLSIFSLANPTAPRLMGGIGSSRPNAVQLLPSNKLMVGGNELIIYEDAPGAD